MKHNSAQAQKSCERDEGLIPEETKQQGRLRMVVEKVISTTRMLRPGGPKT